MIPGFKEIGQLAGVLKNLPRLKEEMARVQESMGRLVAEGDAGAGLVKVRVNGRQEVVGCTLSEEALRAPDKEMLEDLIKAATNQALEKSRSLAREELNKMAAGMGLPPGMMPV